jgi:hypothetical protein
MCIIVVAGTPLSESPRAVVSNGDVPIQAPKMTDCTRLAV